MTIALDDEGPDDIAGFLEKTDYLDSLGEALKLFDRYPYWIDLYVIEVHPDFVDEVLSAVRLRGGTSAEDVGVKRCTASGGVGSSKG